MIEFKPLHKDDLRLLYRWFQEPTINQQYARGQTWSLKDIEIKYFPRLNGYVLCIVPWLRSLYK